MTRQFVIRVREGYAVPGDYDLVRMLGYEDVPDGNGTATRREYIMLANERDEFAVPAAGGAETEQP